MNRRSFIKKGIVGGTSILAVSKSNAANIWVKSGESNKPAILGIQSNAGTWPKWPEWNSATDEKRLLEVMRSGVWSRSKVTDEFEKKWAEMIGAKRALAVVNGTNALNASLAQLEIGWGDEVLVTPYTFIASVSCILLNGAIPVFVDIDPETFQMDPDNIEKKITSRTRAIIPVHILGLPCDMQRIMAIAKKYDLLVVEDACQAWLAEINGKKVGTFGNAGCFSFQNSKNMPIGEGGAIVSDDDEFMDRCYSYHNYGNPFGSTAGQYRAGTVMIGTKLRLTEYQAAIGQSSWSAWSNRRRCETRMRPTSNRSSAKSGIVPYRLYDEVTKAAFHLFPFTYHAEAFKGMPRSMFLQALRAEGVPCSNGYGELNKMPFLKNAFESKYFKKFYSAADIDYERYMEENAFPKNEKLCNEQAVWFGQNLLLAPKEDMRNIAVGIRKIQMNAEAIMSK